MNEESRRRKPEELLEQAQAEEAIANKRGRLKIFLGYASGVGKTVRMLEEARRRRERGQDVVVGAIQPKASLDAQEILKSLEVIPFVNESEGTGIDVEQLIRRRPAICIIDGLAYDNPRGSRNASRWQDVRDLVAAGLKVITSVNIQYVDELRAEVETITGKHVTETVPVSFIQCADEIEIVDAPTTDPIEPDEHGGQDGDRRRQCLSKLREMALVLAADVVDHQLTMYLEQQGIHQHPGAIERILVCITPRANVEDMLETAQIIADRFHGEMIAAYVNQPELTQADQEALHQRMALAEQAGAKVQILEGEDAILAIVDFARSRGVTQVFIGHTQRTGAWSRLWGTPVDKLIRLSRGMDVRIFPH